MGSYTPKVGGNVWTQTLVEMRQESRELLALLERLQRAAASEQGKALLLEAQVHVYRVREGIEVCIRLADGE